MKKNSKLIGTSFYFYIGFLSAFIFSCGLPVETFTKNKERGLADGPLAEAKFNSPHGIAFDNNDNLYVADTGNNCIRKITSEGIVSVFAGSTEGYADGQGREAKFKAPFAIALDQENNLYVTDSGNYRIRKITSAGLVSTIAGNGSEGTNDGVGTSAKFSSLEGIAIDKRNNLFIIDRNAGPLRKISTDGTVSTINFNDKQFEIDAPKWLVIDSKNNIYLTDQGNQFSFSLYKIFPDNTLSLFIDRRSLKFPEAITIDKQDNIYVVNLGGTPSTGNDRVKSSIFKISPSGDITNLNSGDFFEPNALAFHNRTNTLYLVNSETNIISKLLIGK